MRTTNLWFLLILVSTSVVALETNNLREITIQRGRQVGLSEKIISTTPDDSTLVKNDDAPTIGVAGHSNTMTASTGNTINLIVGGERANVPVKLHAFRHEVTMSRGGKEWKPLGGYIELQILSQKTGAFEWSCWQSDAPNPYRFQVFTTESGNSYACCVIRGVQLWRLTESRSSEKMREKNIMNDPHPDALPLLRTGLISDAIGSANLGHGGSFYDVTVDDASEKSGIIRIALHGAKPEPKATFELRDGNWAIVKP